MAAPPTVTYVLLGVIVAVFVLLTVAADVLTAFFGEDLPHDQRVQYEVLMILGAKSRVAIDQGALWRFGTSVILHGSWLHLLMNAYALYVLGQVLERLYGVRRFLVLFIVSGVGGAIASYLFTDGPAVGASGAIFGLIGAAIVFGLKFRGILPARIQRMLTVGLLPWIVLNAFIGTVVPQIDNAAHMGGLVTGCLVAAVLGTRLREPTGQANAALTAILAACLAYMGSSVVAGAIEMAPCTFTVENLESCVYPLLGELGDPAAGD